MQLGRGCVIGGVHGARGVPGVCILLECILVCVCPFQLSLDSEPFDFKTPGTVDFRYMWVKCKYQ